MRQGRSFLIVVDLLKDRPRDRKRDSDCSSDQDKQLKNVVHRHAASPLSHLRPGEQNNKVSQPPEACRRKLDHLYAISTSSPPKGGAFIVAYFLAQYNQQCKSFQGVFAKRCISAVNFGKNTMPGSLQTVRHCADQYKKASPFCYFLRFAGFFLRTL